MVFSLFGLKSQSLRLSLPLSYTRHLCEDIPEHVSPSFSPLEKCVPLLMSSNHMKQMRSSHSVFLDITFPLKNHWPVVESPHECCPVKKKKKEAAMGIKGRHELAHIWCRNQSEAPSMQPLWGGRKGGGGNNCYALAHRRTCMQRCHMSETYGYALSAIVLPSVSPAFHSLRLIWVLRACRYLSNHHMDWFKFKITRHPGEYMRRIPFHLCGPPVYIFFVTSSPH